MANPLVDKMVEEATQAVTAMEGATTVILGIKDMIQKAVDEAVGNGASPEQLEPFAALSQTLDEKTNALAAAVAANTPGAPEEPTEPPADPGTTSARKPQPKK